MAKIFIEESTLTGIGDAIRAKEGSTELVPVNDMAIRIEAIQTGSDPIIESLEITTNGTYTTPEGIDGYNPITVNVPQDGAPTEDDLIFSGDCQYLFANNNWWWVIRDYAPLLTIVAVTNASCMFTNSNQLDELPFTIQFDQSSSFHSIGSMFTNCPALRILPEVLYCKPNDTSNLFSNCYSLREIPEDFFSTWDWSSITTLTSAYQGNRSSFCTYCYSLRKIPENWDFFRYYNKKIYPSYSNYNTLFRSCLALDEVVNIPIVHNDPVTSYTSNIFTNFLYECVRLKNVTFETQEDGNPYIVTNWSNQVIDLSRVGFAAGYQADYITAYNSGITRDKEVKDAATYQALKDDPDWYSTNVSYSRYNHDSAVATINSLPDVSAGTGNTIKFERDAGEFTDGGAINTLTEEEIAVATAKGWTVTLV